MAASPADLEPFRAYLVRRRAREFRRLAAGLRSARFRTITDHWRKALTEVRDARPAPPGSGVLTADELAVARTAPHLPPGRRAGRRDHPGLRPGIPARPAQALQGTALPLEFFAPLHDPVAYRKVVGDLKQLQDCLGEFQDSQVQREEIHALADAMLAERAAPAATLLAMGEIAAKLALSQAEARAAFAGRFAGFAGPAGQERVRTLLTRGPGQ